MTVIRAVVTDGICVGHRCCSASKDQLARLAKLKGDPPPDGPCKNKLRKVRDRFCPEHDKTLRNICHAQPCNRPLLPGKITCDDPSHMAVGHEYEERRTAIFALTGYLNPPGSQLSSDPTVHLDPQTGELVGLEDIRHIDEAERVHERVRDGGESNPKVCLSNRHTHNDQLILCPCGVISARETFYYAESPSAVVVSLLNQYLIL